MKLKKILSAAAVGILCLFCFGFINYRNTFAAENTGLITKCSISCEEYENGKLKISLKTQASGVMSVIGFENITVQYSDDNGVNWHDEKYIGTITQNNLKYLCVDGIITEVTGGRYYRVVCTHTATGSTFASNDTFTQTAFNSSKYVFAQRNEIYNQNIVTETHYDVSTTAIPETTAVPTTTTTTATTTATASTSSSTVSTSSTTALSKTTSETSASLSTVSTTTTTTSSQNIKQESSSVKNSSSYSAQKTNTDRIYEYFGNDSPDTGDKPPVSLMALLMLSVFMAFKSKK